MPRIAWQSDFTIAQASLLVRGSIVAPAISVPKILNLPPEHTDQGQNVSQLFASSGYDISPLPAASEIHSGFSYAVDKVSIQIQLSAVS